MSRSIMMLSLPVIVVPRRVAILRDTKLYEAATMASVSLSSSMFYRVQSQLTGPVKFKTISTSAMSLAAQSDGM